MRSKLEKYRCQKDGYNSHNICLVMNPSVQHPSADRLARVDLFQDFRIPHHDRAVYDDIGDPRTGKSRLADRVVAIVRHRIRIKNRDICNHTRLHAPTLAHAQHRVLDKLRRVVRHLGDRVHQRNHILLAHQAEDLGVGARAARVGTSRFIRRIPGKCVAFFVDIRKGVGAHKGIGVANWGNRHWV